MQNVQHRALNSCPVVGNQSSLPNNERNLTDQDAVRLCQCFSLHPETNRGHIFSRNCQVVIHSLCASNTVSCQAIQKYSHDNIQR
jgi:hypothetical protein